MRELKLEFVDAFTKTVFSGNTAGVIVVEDWLDESLMQAIATQNRLSETAFVKPLYDNKFHIRWFSIKCEIDFCGHATLAASYVLFKQAKLNQIAFTTNEVGDFYITQNNDGLITMSLPNQAPSECDVPEALLSCLSITPAKVLKNRQAYFAIYDSEEHVRALSVNSEVLKQCAPYDLVATAKSQQFDFISRYFWPANGSDEDDVTGSIHTGLAPYWGEQLTKSTMIAYQASARGGTLYLALRDSRVEVSGYCAHYASSTIYL